MSRRDPTMSRLGCRNARLLLHLLKSFESFESLSDVGWVFGEVLRV